MLTGALLHTKKTREGKKKEGYENKAAWKERKGEEGDEKKIDKEVNSGVTFSLTEYSSVKMEACDWDDCLTTCVFVCRHVWVEWRLPFNGLITKSRLLWLKAISTWETPRSAQS